jgi:Glutaminase
MSDPAIIVSGVSGIEPAIERPTADFMAKRAASVAVHFENGQRAHLDPSDPKASVYAEVFDELRRMNIPAYVEVDAASQAVTRLLVPLVGAVTDVTHAATGDTEISIEISHGVHILKSGHPRFRQFLDLLQSAKEQRSVVILSENTDHEIVDVRLSPHPSLPAERFAPPPAFHALAIAAPVTPQRAKVLFDQMKGQTCDPTTVPAPCIPFLYPDDGCWGRAHQMCRLIIAAGEQPAKVWIYGSLTAKTRNNPNCLVRWGWHVAPTLQVNPGAGAETWVVDPSLFNAPVPEANWKGVQGDPAAVLAASDATAFYRAPDGRIQLDPTYSQTAQVLATYRLQLKLRSLSSVGAPPYANCPDVALVS